MSSLQVSGVGKKSCEAEIELAAYDKISLELFNRWLNLWGKSCDAHPFNHPIWFSVAPSSRKNSTRIVVVASKNSRDLMFLAGERHGKKLALLGSPYLEKSSVLMDRGMQGEDFKRVIESLLRDYHQITILESPQDLEKRLHFKTGEAWSLSRPASCSPVFEVEKPQLSAKRRHELRRYTRKLERDHGPLHIEFMPLTIELLRIMRDIEKRSTKPGKGRAELDKRIYFDFLKNAINRYEGMCWIGLMSLAGEPAAHYAGIVYNRKIIGLHMAFDRRFSPYSPGSVLIFNLLPILKSRGIALFEFGRGQSVVKSRFSGEQANLQNTLYFFKKNVGGAFGMFNTVLLWTGISLGRRIRARDIKSVNRILDRLTIKR